jgi:tetratricopeptide (TPR) repeat protein
MNLITRFLTTICILLSAWALANAQKKDQSPLDRVLTELQAGRTEQAYAALDEVIKQFPNLPDAYLLRGTLKMQADPAQALSDFTKVIELKPDAGVAYNQRALLRLVNNDAAGALKDLDASIVHNFKDDSVYYLRSQLRWQTGDFNGAISDLDESIKLNPNNPRTYAARSEMLIALKENDRALADLNYLLNWYETDPSARPVPKNAKAQSQIGEVPDKDSKGFMVGIAQQTNNEAPGDKQMAPAIASAYIGRSLILSARGNHDAAIADLERALRINPSEVNALYQRAIQYEHKGNLTAALADINKAIQLDPKIGNFLVERGVILSLMGRDKEAQVDFDRLLQADRTLWQKRIDERTAAVKKALPIN